MIMAILPLGNFQRSSTLKRILINTCKKSRYTTRTNICPHIKGGTKGELNNINHNYLKLAILNN